MNAVVEIFDDAWVFLTGGSNNVGDYLVEGKKLDKSVIDGWHEVLQRRKDQIQSLNAEYLHVVAPEKLTVYADKCQLISDYLNSPAHQIERGMPAHLLDTVWLNPVNFFNKQKQDFPLYSKTDSHWNFFGAYCTYQLIQARLQLPTNPSILAGEKQKNWTTMDLGAKYDPPLRERVFFYKLSGNVERSYANELVEFKEAMGRENDPGLHVGSYVIYRNSDPVVPRKVLLFGDSFSEYRGHLLTGLLAETYAEVHFVWCASMDTQLIERVRPDIVISELAERFMPRTIPGDDIDIRAFEKRVLESHANV